MKNFIDKILIIIGSAIVAFGLYSIHARCGIAEGGQLGVELLFFNLLGISPAIVSVIIDAISYMIGGAVFGKRFLSNCIIGTISYAVFYYIFETIPVKLIPDLSNQLLFASILGGIIIGIGCGIVIRNNGACGGDDSMAQVITKFLKLPISISYFILDLIVIGLSLSYIPLNEIVYSLITASVSSILIGMIANKNSCTISKD